MAYIERHISLNLHDLLAMPTAVSRRRFLVGLAAALPTFALTGCADTVETVPETLRYTIDRLSLGTSSSTGEGVLAADLTVTNVSDKARTVWFVGTPLTASIDTGELAPCDGVDGRDSLTAVSVAVGSSVTGWVAFELDGVADGEKVALGIAADPSESGVRLANPQTVVPSSLKEVSE